MKKEEVKLMILDRDGVINREQGHITGLSDFFILDGVCEAISQLNAAGIKVCVASNQSGLARGILSEEDLTKIQEYFESELRVHGGWIDHWFYSPWHPDVNLIGGVTKWLGEHEDRKPRAGMLKKALSKTQISVTDAVMVGDSLKDKLAAESLGVRFVGIRSNKCEELSDTDIVFDSLVEVTEYFLSSGQV